MGIVQVSLSRMRHARCMYNQNVKEESVELTVHLFIS